MQDNGKKQAQLVQELQAANDKYDSLFEGAGDSILIVDAETFDILEVNTNAVRRLGYSREELLQLTLTDIEVICESNSASNLEWTSSFSGTRVYECEYRRKDGSLVPVEVSSRLTRNNQREVLQNFARDITKRKRAQAQLRESEEKYRSLTTNLPVGVYRTSVEGQILFANPTLARMLGYDSIEELQATTAIERYADSLEREQQLETWKTQGGAVQQELTLQRKDGELIWVRDIGQILFNENGEIVHIEGILEDITARKQAERKAYEAEQRYRALFEQNNDAVAITSLDGIILDVNPQIINALSLEPDEVIGKHLETFFSPEEIENMVNRREALLAGQKIPIFECDILHKDGTAFPAEINTSLVYDVEGNPTHVHSIFRDITERKQAEAERTQLIADLEAYAHTVAHDLKNPLGIVLGYTGVLEDDLEDKMDDDQRQYFQAISRTTRKMTSIIDELLMLASVRDMEEVPLEALDMGAIVGNAQERLIQQMEEKQAKVILPKTWLPAVGYAPWIEEIWANYISNALKYGGTPPRVELGATLEDEGDNVRFWVQDNGNGLSQEEQARVFAQFSRLEPTRAPGHGLGLSIVKRIVEKLGGRVGVESSLGQGSVFSFTLPMSD